jgi:hypothetical protein
MPAAFVAATSDTATVEAAGDETSSSIAAGSLDDVCVLFGGWAGRFPFSDAGPIGDPVGFDRVLELSNLVVWMRRLDGTESTVEIAWQRNSANAQHHALIFSGLSEAQSDSANDSGTGTNPTKDAVTLLDAGMIVAVCLRDGAPATTVPAGFTTAATSSVSGASFSTEQQMKSAYKAAAAGLDAASTWGPASAAGFDWITATFALNQQGLWVGRVDVELTPGGAAVPSPNGYARLPEVMPTLDEEIEPERSPGLDVPLPTWVEGDPGDPYRSES